MTIDYVAGFFDGEGSITISGSRVRTSTPQTNKEVLEKIRDYVGVGSVYKLTKRQKHWKDAWVYSTTNNNDTMEFLTKLYPHLILKQARAIEGIEVLKQYLNKKKDFEYRKSLVAKMVEEGKSYRYIGRELNMNRQTVCNIMKKVRGVA